MEEVDENAKKLTVADENIPGWMTAMTMTYRVDREAVLKEVSVGDRITATVYEDDVQTLYT